MGHAEFGWRHAEFGAGVRGGGDTRDIYGATGRIVFLGRGMYMSSATENDCHMQ